MSDDGKKDCDKIFVSCHRATELASKSLETELTSCERFAMQFHMLICGFCRRYKKQIGILRQAIRRRADSGEVSGPVLSPEARERIRRALKPD